MGRKASYENGQLLTGLQRTCFWLAIIDVLFYFSTIISCVVIEHVVSNKRPIKFEIQETGITITEPVRLPYGNDDLMALWDYLSTEHYTSAWLYNVVYFIVLTILVSYLILEIWLCCALIRGATERSLGHCQRWFWWRFAVILATIAVGASDIYQMQFTYSLLLWVPLTLFRIFAIMIVHKFIRQLREEAKLHEKVQPLP